MPTSTAVLYPQRWVDFSLIHQPGNGTQAIALGVNGRHRAAIESELLSPDQVSVKTGLYIYYVSLYRILFSLCEVSTQWLAGPIIRTSDPLIDFRVHAPVPSIALPVLDKILSTSVGVILDSDGSKSFVYQMRAMLSNHCSNPATR
jgi:hypothetical protein